LKKIAKAFSLYIWQYIKASKIAEKIIDLALPYFNEVYLDILNISSYSPFNPNIDLNIYPSTFFYNTYDDIYWWSPIPQGDDNELRFTVYSFSMCPSSMSSREEK